MLAGAPLRILGPMDSIFTRALLRSGGWGVGGGDGGVRFGLGPSSVQIVVRGGGGERDSTERDSTVSTERDLYSPSIQITFRRIPLGRNRDRVPGKI